MNNLIRNGQNLSPLRQGLLTVAICAVVTLLAQFLKWIGIPHETLACVYLLAVVMTSACTSGYMYGILASLYTALAYNFFVTAPEYSFHNLTPTLILTFSIMFVISMLISSITSKVKEGEILAHRREEETNVLYQLTKELAGVTSIEAACEIVLSNIAEVFSTDCRILEFDEEEHPRKTFVLYEGSEVYHQVPTNRNRDFQEYLKRPASGFYINDYQHEWPVYSQQGKVLAAIAIPNETCDHLNELDFKILNTMAEACGMAFEKLMLSSRQEKNAREVSQERYKTNLLRSISHDLRTPLSGISGTAEVLMSQLDPDSESYALAANIRKETAWLFNLVQNVLSLTRLQNSGYSIKAEVNILEDVVDSAVETMRMRLPEREIVTSYPEDVLAANIDQALIKQVIINLIDNANKYSPMDSPIEAVVQLKEDDPNKIEVLIRDHGEGISQSALDKIFKMFYTTKAKTEGVMRGYGLGLPICDSIMKAHHGTIEARNRSDGLSGAVFVLTLPLYNPDPANGA